MPAGTGGLEIVCSIAAKGQQFIILCPVQLVDIQTKGRRGREVKPRLPRCGNTTRKSQRGRKPHFPTVHQ